MKDVRWNMVGRLLWADLSLDRKKIIIQCLVVAALTFALLTFSIISGTTMGEFPADVADKLTFDSHTMTVVSAVGNSSFVVLFASLVIFSRIFSNIERQDNEIRYLMLPASNLEKWLSRVAYVVIVGYVFVQLSYYAGSLLWCGVAHLLGSDTGRIVMSALFEPYDLTNTFGLIIPWQVWVSGYGVSFLAYTFYILCGSYYRRLPWLYTMAWGVGIYIALMAVVVVAVIIAVTSGWWNPSTLTGGKFEFDFTPWSPWAGVVGILSALLGILFLRLSYKRFCRRQLETKRLHMI